MTRRAQTRLSRILVAIVGSAAMLLVAPSGAWAGSAHHGNSRHGHHYQYDSGLRHSQAFHRGHRAHGRYRGHHGHDYRRGHPDRRHDRYYCKPCGHSFGTRDALYGHVSGHHHVPFWQLSYAVANYAFGLIFYG